VRSYRGTAAAARPPSRSAASGSAAWPTPRRRLLRQARHPHHPRHPRQARHPRRPV